MMEDMSTWWPKVKKGGLFSGHDYCVNSKERLEYPDLPFCGYYAEGDRQNRDGREKSSQLESAKAVHDFARKHELQISFTMEGRADLSDYGENGGLNPSWYTFKP